MAVVPKLPTSTQPQLKVDRRILVHLVFQNAPEALHRPIGDTSANPRTLCFIPCLSSLALNRLLVYWKPWSLWNSG